MLILVCYAVHCVLFGFAITFLQKRKRECVCESELVAFL